MTERGLRIYCLAINFVSMAKTYIPHATCVSVTLNEVKLIGKVGATPQLGAERRAQFPLATKRLMANGKGRSEDFMCKLSDLYFIELGNGKNCLG